MKLIEQNTLEQGVGEASCGIVRCYGDAHETGRLPTAEIGRGSHRDRHHQRQVP